MVMPSSVNLAFAVGLKVHRDAMVSGPSLPINMIRIITSFPAVPRSGVIPVDRPTVPNAEVTSNASWRNVY